MPLACAVALAGCGSSAREREAALERHRVTEARAVDRIVLLQGALARAQETFDEGDPVRAAQQVADGYTANFPAVRGPLQDVDEDLAASIAADIEGRLRPMVARNGPDAAVDALFEQVQADLTTAVDAIKS